MEFGLFSTSQKLVVRCPESYQYFQIVKLVCERSNIPLLQSKSTVKDALLSVDDSKSCRNINYQNNEKFNYT